MLKESGTPAKGAPAKAIVAVVLFVAAMGFVGWQVYNMFKGEAAPPKAVEEAEARAAELQKAAEALPPPPPPPPPPPADDGPPTRAPKSPRMN